MKKTNIFAICLLALTLCASAVGQAPTASELLQKGIYLEETVGDLDGAMGVYKQVAQMTAESRVNAAQAEFRMGLCLQKKGQAAEAISTFQKVVKDYPEQAVIVAKARELLPAGSKPADTNAKPCEALSNQVPGDPEDVALREKLISCYWEAQTRSMFNSEKGREFERSRVEHVLWLLQHAPARDSAGAPSASNMAAPEDYIKIRQEWLKQVQAHARDANVLANAAHFMDSSDRDQAEELASKAHTLDPKNVRAAGVLAELYERKVPGSKPELRAEISQQALQLREQIWSAMQPDTGPASVPALQRLTKDALAAGENTKAKSYAEELLRRSDGDAVHQGNMVLGRLALQSGNVEEAKRRLLASGKTTGSPVLGSFGPNMQLAQELLQKGEQEAVLQYFDECEVFWKRGNAKLNEWREAVRQGRIPAFGANLLY